MDLVLRSDPIPNIIPCSLTTSSTLSSAYVFTPLVILTEKLSDLVNLSMITQIGHTSSRSVAKPLTNPGTVVLFPAGSFSHHTSSVSQHSLHALLEVMSRQLEYTTILVNSKCGWGSPTRDPLLLPLNVGYAYPSFTS